MTTYYIPEDLKNLVKSTAKFAYEYCLLPDQAAYFSFHFDHIISRKHGGLTVANNLAYACPLCNLNKGSDIATFLDSLDVPVRFYNPRKDNWHQHFQVEESGLILPKTQIGEATIKILKLNHVDAVIERKEMVRLRLIY
jgi:hypothetical protein